MSEKTVSEGTIQVPYYPDDVGLNTDDVKRPINMLDDLLKYLATVRKRWGNTAVTCSLQWGSSALWMRSEQAETIAAQSARIAELEEKLAAIEFENKRLVAERDTIQDAATVAEMSLADVSAERDKLRAYAECANYILHGAKFDWSTAKLLGHHDGEGLSAFMYKVYPTLTTQQGR